MGGGVPREEGGVRHGGADAGAGTTQCAHDTPEEAESCLSSSSQEGGEQEGGEDEEKGPDWKKPLPVLGGSRGLT